ncbi:MAG: hypothetical protein AMXMBFR34_18740 [Myxococcaceae bacterium]
MSRLLPALLAVLLLTACGDGYVQRPTQVNFDPDANDFWGVPLPSELRRQADGSYNLERWPGPRPQLVKMWLDAIDARLTEGWGVNSGAFFVLSGDLDPATLPSDPSQTLTMEAPVQLVDIDPTSPEYGRRFPLEVTFSTAAAPYRPARMLALNTVQGFVRRPHTTYAVLLTDALLDTSGQPLGRSRPFHAALEHLPDADAKAQEALSPLRDFLLKERWPRGRVVGATVFRTLDPSAALTKLAAWVETLPQPALATPWTKADEYPDFTLYTAAYEVPHLQAGAIPGKGRIVWNDDGTAPVQQGTQRVRLSISIPKVAAPAGGYPLMLYFHGSGGEYREVMDRGPLPQTATRDMLPEPPKGSGPAAWLGRRGVATMGFDFPLHGDRDSPPDTTGLRLYDLFGDIDSTVDNMQVAAMEAVYLTRLLEGMTVPLDGGGTATFDTARVSAMGQSMGSTIGIPVATVAKRIHGFVFSGAGGLLLEVATTATYPVDLRAALETILGFQAGQALDNKHPLLNAFQALWDFIDPTAKARHVAREPHPGQQPQPFFMPHGVVDGYFHPGAQAAVAVSLGTTLVGEEVDPLEPKALRLDGRGTQPSFPLKGNQNGVTAATVHLRVPFELGHYVVFDMAGVSSQVACFVLGVGTPAGPSLVAPRGLDEPCP